MNAFREPGTDVVMHANYPYWRDDNVRLGGYRAPKTQFASQKFTDAVIEYFKDLDTASRWAPSPITYRSRTPSAV